MRRALLVLPLLVAGCGPPDELPAAVPRARLSPAAVLQAVRGMNYDPVDIPLAWTPDGRVILAHQESYSAADVYDAVCAGTGIYELSLRDTTVRPLAVGEGACQAVHGDGVDVHPDGRSVIYSEYAEVNRSRLARLDLATRRVDTLATGCRIYNEAPAISRDGEWIAGHGLCDSRDEEGYQVFVVKLDGSVRRRLNEPRGGSLRTPAWSPDGQRLAVVHSPSHAPGRGEVRIIDIASGEHAVIGRGGAPAWSPTGDRIAFLASDDDDDRTLTIRVVAPDGSGWREVFRNRVRTTYSRGWGPQREGEPGGPLVWSPDGEALLFTRRFDGGTSIWRLDLASGDVAPLTRPDRRRPDAG